MANQFVWPSTKTDQDKLKEKIENAVRLKHELDVINSDIKTLAEEAKELSGISSGEFNKYVAASYDKDKFLETKEKLEEISSNLELE